MEAYAVLETGGKQYRVTVGETLEIERLEAESGKDVELTSVLALSDGKELKIGMPYVAGAKVVLNVVGEKLGKKVVNFKQKRRKNWRRTKGHRQQLTVVTVKEIA